MLSYCPINQRSIKLIICYHLTFFSLFSFSFNSGNINNKKSRQKQEKTILKQILKWFTDVNNICHDIQTYKQSPSDDLLKNIANGMHTLDKDVTYKIRTGTVELFERYEALIKAKQDEAEKLFGNGQDDDSIQAGYGVLKSRSKQLMGDSITFKDTISEVHTVGEFAIKVVLLEKLAILIVEYDKLIKSKRKDFQPSENSTSPKKVVSLVEKLQRR